MLRFVIRRKMLDRGSSLASEGLETVDAECPELERSLQGGGTGIDSYDYRELAGVEVLPDTRTDSDLLAAVAEILDDGHMNQEHLARLRAAYERA
jgi:hypothetical protein